MGHRVISWPQAGYRVTYILVLSRGLNLRRYCVDNLVIRGYIAIGLASIHEGATLFQRNPPDCILLCQIPDLNEGDLKAIRTYPELDRTPLLIMSADRPAPDWMARWRIATHLAPLTAASEIVEQLSPWLSGSGLHAH